MPKQQALLLSALMKGQVKYWRVHRKSALTYIVDPYVCILLRISRKLTTGVPTGVVRNKYTKVHFQTQTLVYDSLNIKIPIVKIYLCQ